MSDFTKVASGPVGYGIAAVIAVGAAYWILSRVTSGVKDVVKSSVDTVSKANQGTAYEGYGAVGTLGHIFDWGSGVLVGADKSLSKLGSGIGDTIYDWTHPEASANIAQSASNKPHQAGPFSDYAQAVSESPTLPQYAGSPLNNTHVGVGFTGGSTGTW